MTKKNVFEHESYQDCESITHFLESLKNGFKKGHITLKTDSEETVVMYPEDLLKFSLKVRQKSERNKITIKLSWKKGVEPENKNENILIES